MNVGIGVIVLVGVIVGIIVGVLVGMTGIGVRVHGGIGPGMYPLPSPVITLIAICMPGM